jgi:hypothetical protein
LENVHYPITKINGIIQDGETNGFEWFKALNQLLPIKEKDNEIPKISYPD